MHQAYKKAAVLAIATLLGWGGIHSYYRYTQDMIYQESTDSLRATYKQVGTSFRLFTQRNWNILSVYEKNIQLLPAEYRTDDRWKVLLGARDQWMYRDFYLFEKSGHFVTDGGRKGQADSFKAVVEAVEKEGKPILSSYVSMDGTRRVVFAVPFKEPLTIDGIDYMGIAASYDNQVVERLITGNIYDGESDCYVVDEAGNVVLSLTPKSEIPEHVDNILSYLKVHDAAEEKGSLEWMARGIREEQGGSLLISLGERKYYTVYRPLGIGHLSLVGLVRDRVVDEGLVRVRNATVFALAAIFSLLAFFMIGVTIKETRQRLHEKEQEKKVLASQKEMMRELFGGMGRVADRFVVANLKTDRYYYGENQLKKSLYPETGCFSLLVEKLSRAFVATGDAEHMKLSQLLSKEHLVSVLKSKDDLMRFECCGRQKQAFGLMTVVPISWDKKGMLEKVMCISQDIGEKHDLETLANTDGLTGLFNERYFTMMLQSKEKKKLPFVLVYLDLDHFKPINDTYGHAMGDKLLQETAKRLLQCIRKNDYVFRIGGDEFTILFSMDFDENLASEIRERLKTMLEKPFEIDGHTLKVGCSIGLAAYPKESSDAAYIRILADRRMYEEKEKNHKGR